MSPLRQENPPKVLVASVPKCGTHLLKQIIMGVPCLVKGSWILQKNEFFADMNKCRPGTVMVGHLFYKTGLVNYLNKNHIPRFFIYRDPRDMIVSYVYYVKDIAKEHELREYFTHSLQTDEERIMKLTTGFTLKEPSLRYGDITTHYAPFHGWMQDPNTFTLQFEDLVESEQLRQQTIRHMVDYMWDDIKSFGSNKDRVTKAMEQNINPKKSGTFRRGISGGWRDYFTDENKKIFKEVAGQFLIELGYEKDLDW